MFLKVVSGFGSPGVRAVRADLDFIHKMVAIALTAGAGGVALAAKLVGDGAGIAFIGISARLDTEPGMGSCGGCRSWG